MHRKEGFYRDENFFEVGQQILEENIKLSIPQIVYRSSLVVRNSILFQNLGEIYVILY
jgi:hypothetical protein